MADGASAGELRCGRCGTAFTLAASVRARHPGWTPQLCASCYTSAGAAKSSTARAGARGGAARGGTAARRGSARTRAAASPAEALERFSGGPESGVFTDGSCSGNPGPGGWGAVRVQGGQLLEERAGGEADTTNNRMELQAMIAGLELVRPGEAVEVYSDSRLVVQTLTSWAAAWERRGWERESGPVSNLDLVQEAYALARARPCARIQWLRAHDGTRWNEYVDALATTEARARAG